MSRAYDGARQRNQASKLVWAAACALALDTIAVSLDQARAQEAATDELEQITVTASRRSNGLLETPLAVDALSGDQLRDFDITSLQDLNKIDPSVTVANFGAGQQKLIIRGISSNIAATTGLYLDEAPLLGGFQNSFWGDGTPGMRLHDVERVEVLKGPQGTLFGSGSMDGTLRVITNKPQLNAISGSFDAQAGTVDSGTGYYNGDGVINLPIINDVLGVRAVVWGEEGGGFIDQIIGGRTLNNVNVEHLKGGRLTALFAPYSAFNVSASVSYQETDVDGNQGWQQNLGPYTDAESSRSPFHQGYLLLNLTANYSLDFADLVAVYSKGRNSIYQPFDSTPTNCGFGLCPPFLPPLSFIPIVHYGDQTGEIRFSSKFSGPAQVVAGVYYQNDLTQYAGNAIFTAPDGLPGCETLAQCNADGLRNPGPNLNGGYPSNWFEFGAADHLNVEQYATYAQTDINIIDPLTLTAGVRYFHARIADTSYSTQDIAPTASTACSWVTGCVTVPYVTFSDVSTESKTTYNFALLYRFTPDLSAYARAASGFRIGGVNSEYNAAVAFGATGVPRTFAPDTVADREVGLKAYFLQRRLYTELTYYHMDWSNQQTNAVADNTFAYTLNAGRTKIDGVELNLNYLLVQGLTTTLGLTYVNGRLAETLPAAVATSGNGGNAGDPLPLVPHWSAAASAEYKFPIAGALRGYITGSTNYRDSTQLGFNATDSFYTRIPSFILGNLKAGVTWSQYQVGVFVDNVGNTAAEEGVFKSPDGTRVFSDRPRTVGVAVSAAF